MRRVRLLVTCEHGGRRVPKRYAHLFVGAQARRALASHRGCDDGALRVAHSLARRLGGALLAATVTRLLVDLNRSRHHRALFSEFSAAVDDAERARILARYYEPHRNAVREAAMAGVRKGTLVHVGVHSFTPRLGRVRRRTDIGLLYDPKRRLERAFCMRWGQLLFEREPVLDVRRNYPYRGRADGLTTSLRRQFGADRYLGIELEVNQARLAPGAPGRRRLLAALGATLERTLEELRSGAL